MNYSALVGTNRYKISLSEKGGKLQLKLNDQPFEIEELRIGSGNIVKLTTAGRSYEIFVEKNRDDYHCWLNSRLLKCVVVDEKSARYAGMAGRGEASRKGYLLTAPMPGLILKIEVESGQKVEKGQGLVIMEAMKMENELRSAHSGIVKEIKVSTGQAVNKNQVLLTIE